MFLNAMHDVNIALDMDAKHIKSKSRLARALDGLGRHEQALKLMNTFKCPKSDVSAVQRRLRQSHGDYGRLDSALLTSTMVADYIGPVEVRSAGSKGRGLFLTKHVAKGELLFAERAYAASFREEKKVGLHFEYSEEEGLAGTGRCNDASQEELIRLALERAHSHAVENERLAYLCGGPLETVVPDMRTLKLELDSPVEEAVQCSVGHVRQIQKRNTFGCDNWTALWIIASFMNHHKHCNVNNKLVPLHGGMMMFVRARGALSEGELNYCKCAFAVSSI
jgi:hypothetical protein